MQKKHVLRFLELRNKQIGVTETITQFESAPSTAAYGHGVLQ